MHNEYKWNSSETLHLGIAQLELSWIVADFCVDVTNYVAKRAKLSFDTFLVSPSRLIKVYMVFCIADTIVTEVSMTTLHCWCYSNTNAKSLCIVDDIVTTGSPHYIVLVIVLLYYQTCNMTWHLGYCIINNAKWSLTLLLPYHQ